MKTLQSIALTSLAALLITGCEPQQMESPYSTQNPMKRDVRTIRLEGKITGVQHGAISATLWENQSAFSHSVDFVYFTLPQRQEPIVLISPISQPIQLRDAHITYEPVVDLTADSFIKTYIKPSGNAVVNHKIPVNGVIVQDGIKYK